MGHRRVRDLMTSQVTTIYRREDLSVADFIMTLGRIRHIPVLDDNGSLCGIVTHRDLIFHVLSSALTEGKAANALPVSGAMTVDVVVISPDATLGDAAELMIEKKIGCLPVVENGELVGMLTETDFVAAFT